MFCPFSQQLEHCGNGKLAVTRNEWTHLALRSRVRGSCLLGICRLLRNSEYLNELIIYANVVGLFVHQLYQAIIYLD